MSAADSVTILRDGQLVVTRKKSEITMEEMAALMIGRGSEGVIRVSGKVDVSTDNVALRLRDLWVDMPGEMVKGIDLDVREGEIIGIAGLAGQGKMACQTA